MTIAELRKKYPHSEFYFFKDGYELQKAPFYHSKIKSYRFVMTWSKESECLKDTIFIDL